MSALSSGMKFCFSLHKEGVGCEITGMERERRKNTPKRGRNRRHEGERKWQFSKKQKPVELVSSFLGGLVGLTSLTPLILDKL